MLTIFHQTIESVVSLRAPISASRRKRNEHRREIKQTSKTGISSNPVVNAAIQEMARKALESGTGASATGTIPVLLKKLARPRKEWRQRRHRRLAEAAAMEAII